MIIHGQTQNQLAFHPCDCANLPEIEYQDGIWYVYCLTCLTCYDGQTLEDAIEKWIQYNPAVEYESH